MNAEIIVIKQNTIGRRGNESEGPMTISPATTAEGKLDFKPVIQNIFDTTLRGIAGTVLVNYNGRLFLCERNNIDPHKPYVRTGIQYHPLAVKFTSRVV
jgi:hypothetical protein